MWLILVEGRGRWQNGGGPHEKQATCRRAVSLAVIRRANTAVETQTTREIKYCDDLFHKGQTGGRWISGLHTQTRPLIWLRGRWTLVVDVHIIFLAGQSSPILAVHNGAAGDTRCFSRLHSERQGHPVTLNWIDLSLFGLHSAGLPSQGPAVCKGSSKRDKRRRKNWKGLQRKCVSLQRRFHSRAAMTLSSLFLKMLW